MSMKYMNGSFYVGGNAPYSGGTQYSPATAFDNSVFEQLGVDLFNQSGGMNQFSPMSMTNPVIPQATGNPSGLPFNVGSQEGGGGGGGFNIGKLAGMAALLGGGLAGIGAFQQSDPMRGFNPELTGGSVRELISSQRIAGNQAISRQTAQVRGDVGSQYAARGLGQAGAAVGDIANVEGQSMQARTNLEAQLNAQLLSALQAIDQRNAMMASQRSATRTQQLSGLADLGLTLGSLFL